MKKTNLIYLRPIIFFAIAFILFTPNKTYSQSTSAYTHSKLLIRDEGLSQIAYVDLNSTSANWYLPIPAGRDLQLVGAGRLLAGTGNGYEEHEIATGKKVYELTNFPGTIAARRLRNGNTILSGVNWQGKQGIVLVEVDAAGAVLHLYNFPEFNYVRLVRETVAGNFLVTADNVIFEGNKNGDVVWKVIIGEPAKTHAWQALRRANGQTIVSTGYQKKLELFSADGKLLDTITGPAEVNPNFFSGFQVLTNGNYIVSNWQGHGPNQGASGIQVLEFTPQGKLVWNWKQDATKFSSLHSVIVLDGLDLNFLHVEDGDGKLSPVKIKAKR